MVKIKPRPSRHLQQAERPAATTSPGERPLEPWLRYRVHMLSVARVQELANAQESQARRRLAADPERVEVVALVDSATLTAAMAEGAEKARGRRLGYEAVLGEWAARPR